jgi:hypothetical protein
LPEEAGPDAATAGGNPTVTVLATGSLAAAFTAACSGVLAHLDQASWAGPQFPYDPIQYSYLELAAMSGMAGVVFGPMFGAPFLLFAALVLPKTTVAARQWPIAVSGGAVGAVALMAFAGGSAGQAMAISVLGGVAGAVAWERGRHDSRVGWRVVAAIWTATGILVALVVGQHALVRLS